MLPQLRAHADLIDPIAFERFLRDAAGGHDFDVMLEAKAKDLALLRLRELVPVHLREDRPRAAFACAPVRT